jgi:hypothetical protein
MRVWARRVDWYSQVKTVNVGEGVINKEQVLFIHQLIQETIHEAFTTALRNYL